MSNLFLIPSHEFDYLYLFFRFYKHSLISVSITMPLQVEQPVDKDADGRGGVPVQFVKWSDASLRCSTLSRASLGMCDYL